jgi:diketogulonate reductase-like aldo/keto reductase
MSPKLSISSTLPLANSKFKIPQIGFGVYQSPPPTCVQSCVKAFSAGYRHIDTAQYYDNESSVGRSLREAKVPRADIFLTSKILSPGKDVDSTYNSIVESVKKLDGEDGYVDLFLIHSPNGGKESRSLMWLALEKAKETGKVRNIGVSNYGIGHIEEIKEIGNVWPPVVNQIEVRAQPSTNPLRPIETGHFACDAIVLYSIHPLTPSAPSLVPTTRSRRILREKQHRHRSLLPPRQEPESARQDSQ